MRGVIVDDDGWTWRGGVGALAEHAAFASVDGIDHAVARVAL